MSGKGSGRRPTEVSEQSFADNWSRIFGLSGRSSTAEQVALTHPVVCSNQTAPANLRVVQLAESRTPNPLDGGSNPSPLAIYVDDATGK